MLALLLIVVSINGIVQGNPSLGAAVVSQEPGEQKANQNPPTGQAGSQGRPERVEIDELPRDIYSYLERGNRFAAARHYDEAIAEYKLALERAHRPVFTVLLAMGSAYFDKKDFKEAAEAYRQAITARPNDFTGYFNLGESLYELGDYAEAEQAYRRALALNPGMHEPQIRQFLALSLYNQKRLDEAVTEYRLAIDKAKGKYSEAYYNLGIALMDRGDLAGSESALRSAIEQDKQGFPEAHYNLGLVLEKQGRIPEAVQQYQAYLLGWPDATNADSLRQHIEPLLKKK